MNKLTAIVTVLCVSICGCGDWSQMPSVPRSTLRDINTLELQPAATEPTTIPVNIPSRVAATQPTSPEFPLSIEQARTIALTNNLDLAVDLLNPTISHTSISEEEAHFEALFTTDVNYAITDAPQVVSTESAQADASSVTPGVTLPLRTGGTLIMNAPMTWSDTDNAFNNLNPAYTTETQAIFAQPLLRNAGPFVAEQSIRVARYNYLRSEAQTKLAIIGVLANIDRAYWRLYAAREDEAVRKKEYDLAVAQLDRARRMVNAGASAEVEVIRAESGVADAVEQVINAENVVRTDQRDLKRMLNQPGLDLDTPDIIVPTTAARTLYYRIEPEALATQAIATRMEMLDLELQLAEQSSDIEVARNGLLPLVDLTYSYGVNGLGGRFDDAWTQLGENRFQNQNIGMHVEIPIGNEAAKARLRRALATRLQTLATKSQRIAAIRQELFNAIDQLDTNWYRILATRKAVDAARRTLEAEIRSFTQGLRTSTDVIDAQTKLGDAASAHIAAVSDYQISQVDIAVATGTVLGASRVQWQPTTEPSAK